MNYLLNVNDKFPTTSKVKLRVTGQKKNNDNKLYM